MGKALKGRNTIAMGAAHREDKMNLYSPVRAQDVKDDVFFMEAGIVEK